MRALTTQQAIKLLQRHHLIVLPTDTIYGISAVVCKQNLHRINGVKKRPKNQPCVLIVDKLKRVEHWLDSINSRDYKVATNSKQTTFLLAAHAAPSWLAHNGLIAVRVCPNQTIKIICKTLDAPLFSTSINTHGEPACLTPNQIRQNTLASHITGMVHMQMPTNTNASKIINLQKKTTIRA